MDTSILRPGHRIRTSDGRQAEVLEESREGAAVRIGYLDDAGPFGVPRHTGEEDLVGGEEVAVLMGVVPPSTWKKVVTVILHYIAESEDGPAEYRAETLSGVPNDVVVNGGSDSSAQEALNHLLGGLLLMGFSGTVVVEDGAREDFERYEVEFPAGE